MARIGFSASRRLMLTAARFDGEEALRLGLADFLVESESEFEGFLNDLKNDIFRAAPKANAKTKSLLFDSLHLNSKDFRIHAARAFTDCILDDEGIEGISSFMEKRKPSWSI
jgi:isohexenylglutaconyl-CoA hydratase